MQLDIKWYFNSEPTPFYQWVPEKMSRPQIIGDKFRHHVDLDHVVHPDSHKRHRALLLKRPTTELSGLYTCKVSSFISEDVRRKRMTVYCKFFFQTWTLCKSIRKFASQYEFGSNFIVLLVLNSKCKIKTVFVNFIIFVSRKFNMLELLCVIKCTFRNKNSLFMIYWIHKFDMLYF